MILNAKIAFLLSSFTLFIVMFAEEAFSQRGSYEMIDGDAMHYILPRDAIPAIDDPDFTTVKEAEKFMMDDELLLGVVINGDARAYSTWHLDRHEIVNDYVGDTHISVSW